MNRLNIICQQISSSSQITLNNLEKIKVSFYSQNKIGIITLNSSKDLNSLSQRMLDELIWSMNYLQNIQTIKVIILQSSHEKIFCAGADIKRFLKKDYQYYIKNQIFSILQSAFKTYKKPIIAAVNGKALGGGFELALLADVIIASENAYFALPEVNLGLMPGIGGTQRLAKIIGQKLAMRYILSSEGFDGKKAHQMNICELVPADKFTQNVLKITQKIAQKAITTLIIAKRAIKYATDSTLTQGLQFEKSTFYPMLATKAAKQGISAFVQKRKANFNGM